MHEETKHFVIPTDCFVFILHKFERKSWWLPLRPEALKCLQYNKCHSITSIQKHLFISVYSILFLNLC